MPLWIIYHPSSVFTDPETKRAFAQAITDIYTAVPLPAFYVNVLFQPIEATSFYIGGVPRPSPQTEANQPGPDSEKPFIRISIQNIARTMYVRFPQS
jgi:phenylpyruvate tautomerase PptA (4-oxalocrotonate tautomerase family)